MSKKGGRRRSTMRWKEIDPEDVKIGDYVKGTTWTHAQQGPDYNFTVRGTVIEESSQAYNIKVETSKGKIKNLCRFVGTSGGNEIYKAVDKRPPSGTFHHLFDRQLTNKNRRLTNLTNRNYNDSPNSSIASSNASSIMPSASRSRSRSRSRTRSRSRSRSSGGKSNKTLKKKKPAYRL